MKITIIVCLLGMFMLHTYVHAQCGIILPRSTARAKGKILLHPGIAVSAKSTVMRFRYHTIAYQAICRRCRIPYSRIW